MSFAVGQTGLAFARLWHLVDAKGQVLGHFTRGIASTLVGEHKPVFDPSNDCGDYVVVINARHIQVSGDKERTKIYRYHSGYPSGLKTIPFWQMIKKRPEEVIRHAVYGQLPKNNLRKRRIGRLLVFPDEKHPYEKNIAKFYEDPDLAKIQRSEWAKLSGEEIREFNKQQQLKKLASFMTK